MCIITIELHVKDTDFSLSGHYFRPNMGMNITIFLDELGVIDEF